MQPILTKLQIIDIKLPGLKERIFNEVVDLHFRQFDQLCSEIIALYRFQRKYRNVLITDAPDLIRPFVHFLPRVELLVVINEHSYNRNLFYRWLESVEIKELQQLFMELDALYDQVIENVDCFMVDEKICGTQADSHCWKLQLGDSGNLSVLFNNVRTWKNKSSGE